MQGIVEAVEETFEGCDAHAQTDNTAGHDNGKGSPPQWHEQVGCAVPEATEKEHKVGLDDKERREEKYDGNAECLYVNGGAIQRLVLEVRAVAY